MARVKSPNPPSQNARPIRPALTPEAREQQLISLAYDLVEQRLLDGTASAQETTYFLKLASRKVKLEGDRLEYETELIKAKTQNLRDQADMKSLCEDAIAAMRSYKGYDDDPDDEEFDDYDRR